MSRRRVRTSAGGAEQRDPAERDGERRPVRRAGCRRPCRRRRRARGRAGTRRGRRHRRGRARPTRSFSTRKIQTSVPTSAGTWLCTTEPIATPSSAQSTTPSTSCRRARRRRRRRARARRRRPRSRPRRRRRRSGAPAARRGSRRARPRRPCPRALARGAGVASSVGVIVPCRNSVVTIVIPRMIASKDAIPSRSTSASWKSRPLRSSSEREPTSAAAPIPTRPTSTSRYAHQPRVVRSLSSSERTSGGHSVVSPPVSSRKTSSSVALLDGELVQDDPVRGRELADPLRRRLDEEGAVLGLRDGRAACARAARAAAPRRASAPASTRCAPASTLRHRRLLDEPAAVDDHDAVGGLRRPRRGRGWRRGSSGPRRRASAGSRAASGSRPDRARSPARRARAPPDRRAARSRARAAGACPASSP